MPSDSEPQHVIVGCDADVEVELSRGLSDRLDHSLSPQQVRSAQFTNWYPKLRRDSIRSISIPLSAEFCAWLLSDSIHLPSDLEGLTQPVDAQRDDIHCDFDDQDNDWLKSIAQQEADKNQDESEESESDSEASEADHRYTCARDFFPSECEAIKAAIRQLSGAVCPRLNWRGCSDASWIAPDKTSRCTSITDVLLLIKSSDKIASQLQEPFEDCNVDRIDAKPGESESCKPDAVAYTLILRRWSHLHASREFRLFVAQSQVLAISQRHNEVHPHLKSEEAKLRQIITSFFASRIADVLETELHLPHCVLDLYVDTMSRCWLINIRNWQPNTEPAQFEWREIKQIEAQVTRPISIKQKDASETSDATAASAESTFCVSRANRIELPVMRILQEESSFPRDESHQERIESDDASLPKSESTSLDAESSFDSVSDSNPASISSASLFAPSLARRIVSRLPHKDNIDTSDARGIERFVQVCKLQQETNSRHHNQANKE